MFVQPAADVIRFKQFFMSVNVQKLDEMYSRVEEKYWVVRKN